MAKEQETITRGLRIEIVKPIGNTWDDVGPVLRTQRGVMHRLLTASALAAIEADRKSRKGEGKVHPQTAAYRAVTEELEDIQQWAWDKLKKKSTKDRVHLERLSNLALPGGTKAGISSIAWAHVGKWKKDKGKTRVPTWKYGAPIPVRAQESSLSIRDGAVVLSVKLAQKGRQDFVVRAGKGAQWGRLKRLAEGAEGLKRGDVKISYSVRDKKWFAVIAMTEPKPTCPDLNASNALVLHRGQRNLVVAMTSMGHYTVIAKGNKLREFKRRMRKRREDVQGVPSAERGSGSSGHGRKRRYAMAEALSAKEDAFVHTLCQQMGARVAELAKRWGCGQVYIENFGGTEDDEDRGKRQYLERFPNYQMRQCIEWSLKKTGIPLGTYDHEYISQTCPRCGNVDEKQHNSRTGVFHCRACSFDRPVDWISALHALRRVGASEIWEARLNAEAKLAKDLAGARASG